MSLCVFSTLWTTNNYDCFFLMFVISCLRVLISFNTPGLYSHLKTHCMIQREHLFSIVFNCTEQHRSKRHASENIKHESRKETGRGKRLLELTLTTNNCHVYNICSLKLELSQERTTVPGPSVERMAIDDVIRFLNNAVSVIHCPKDAATVPLPARVDPFRTSPIRVLGHFFAMGEASKFHYTEDVCEILSHVATSYILCHAVYQALNARGGKASVVALFDTLVFDGFASAIIPSTLTFYIIRMTTVLLQEINPIPRVVLRWGPVVSGLAAIAFTYEVIDRCVDQVLDETVRSLY